MKDQTWIILPFSMSCVSESSICIGGGGEKGMTKRSLSSSIRTKQRKKAASSRKPSSTCGSRFHRLIKNLRTNISQLFAYKDDDDDEEEGEMEIGLPTDVKHLTHIGWDGSTTTMNNTISSIAHQQQPFKGWEDNSSGAVKLPSISLKQFEMAMAAQVDQHNQNFSPSTNGNSSSSNTTTSSGTQKSWSTVSASHQNNSNLVAHQ